LLLSCAGLRLRRVAPGPLAGRVALDLRVLEFRVTLRLGRRRLLRPIAGARDQVAERSGTGHRHEEAQPQTSPFQTVHALVRRFHVGLVASSERIISASGIYRTGTRYRVRATDPKAGTLKEGNREFEGISLEQAVFKRRKKKPSNSRALGEREK